MPGELSGVPRKEPASAEMSRAMPASTMGTLTPRRLFNARCKSGPTDSISRTYWRLAYSDREIWKPSRSWIVDISGSAKITWSGRS